MSRQNFLSRSLGVRHESLENLWDAWERLKTVEVVKNKKRALRPYWTRLQLSPTSAIGDRMAVFRPARGEQEEKRSQMVVSESEEQRANFAFLPIDDDVQSWNSDEYGTGYQARQEGATASLTATLVGPMSTWTSFMLEIASSELGIRGMAGLPNLAASPSEPSIHR